MLKNHKKPKKGFIVVKRKDPITDRKGWMPLRSKSKRPIFVGPGEPDHYPTKQKAINATHKYN